MIGSLSPYTPELTIRDYNTFLWYGRGVRRQMCETYGCYSARVLSDNGVLVAVLADSIAGREATCQTVRMPGTLSRKPAMCQTQGIRHAAQIEIIVGWHHWQDCDIAALTSRERMLRKTDSVLLRRAFGRVAKENSSLERLMAQEREQAIAQMQIGTKNYTQSAEPVSNVYAALFSTLADDDDKRKNLRYIGSCIGRIFYLLDKAEHVEDDIKNGSYNVFALNGITNKEAALENARRQSLAAANDVVRVYNMLDIKLNRSLLDNIMILGLRHAVYPLEQGETLQNWELP